MNYANKHAQEGFTLIEILIAFALVMILGGVVYVSTKGIVERNRRTATLESMRVIRNALEQFREDFDQYPSSLRDLIKKPADEKIAEEWNPYIETKKGELKDGWGQPFHYAPTPGGEHEYELYSYGSKQGKSAPKSGWLDVWKKL